MELSVRDDEWDGRFIELEGSISKSNFDLMILIDAQESDSGGLTSTHPMALEIAQKVKTFLESEYPELKKDKV